MSYSDYSNVICPSISSVVYIIWMYSNTLHSVGLSCSSISSSSENTEIVIRWLYDTIHTVGSSQYLGGSDDGAATGMVVIDFQGDLPWEFTYEGSCTTDDRLGFVGECFYKSTYMTIWRLKTIDIHDFKTFVRKI